MRFYPLFFRAAFSWMDAERAHRIGYGAIRAVHGVGLGRVLGALSAPGPELRTSVFGVEFPSPFGLAAGFDKEGRCIEALAELGFGHIEVGTVTGQAQPGNPRPRLFRLIKDRAVVNRMGFNNDGAEAVAPRIAAARASLEERYGTHRPIIGINIGKTKVVELEDAADDYRASARALAPFADYLVVNVSSPNTPGLRLLQSVETLRPLLEAVREESTSAAGRRVPLLVKIAPDLADSDIDDVARLAVDLGLEGIIATNTTIGREGLESDSAAVEACGAGGLSGAPLKARSLEVLRRLASMAGDRLALVSVGGVETAADVRERLAAGASLVQGYTAFLYEGPFWAASVNRGLTKAAPVTTGTGRA
ncbi:quinone-dependent dihydroorotate dehydrogenase [Sinomonas sp. JGH33]|uniref:Dihydroorotate dehydrogenase (quinone) n=1 Tax=Sinomonas terricola TaxID=3110330 RepID=A0ABU5T725_9MICC|nr:quinone-dependent dihydroorotate dehydrogenase [Sinomonas sp. JGH33]MEA5455309.1 quinone-dependent dihydroorotate dehydrogenase [Sinomonas sp. JGH33]